MNKKGNLFIVSGPSGTGKGTVCNELLKKENIFLSVSSTTREIRKDEVPGETYNYVTEKEFTDMIDNGEMLEYAEYNGHYYGTPAKAVETQMNTGKNVLLEIEPQGALKVKKIFEDAILIFIVPPSVKELKRRLEKRGRESSEQIEKRLETAKWEMEQGYKYNHVVVNDGLEDCVDDVIGIIHRRDAERKLIDKIIEEF